MRLELSNHWKNYINKIPETGMGYHTVNVRLKNNILLENRTIINGTYLEILENELTNEDIKNIG